MTTDDQLFVTLLQQAFGGREFTAAQVLERVHPDALPDHAAREIHRPSNPPKNLVRLLGRWLVNREGVASLADSAAILHKYRKVSNLQRWRVAEPGSPVPEVTAPEPGQTITVHIGG